MKYPEFLYHGTSTKYIESIFKIGLSPPWDYKDCVICWSSELVVAEWHANCMTESDRGGSNKSCKQIIFKIPFERFDTKGFRLEKNYIRLGPSGHPRINRIPPRDSEGKRWKWESLLVYAGAVGYKYPLPVTENDFFYMSRYKISKTNRNSRKRDEEKRIRLIKEGVWDAKADLYGNIEKN